MMRKNLPRHERNCHKRKISTFACPFPGCSKTYLGQQENFDVHYRKHHLNEKVKRNRKNKVPEPIKATRQRAKEQQPTVPIKVTQRAKKQQIRVPIKATHRRNKNQQPPGEETPTPMDLEVVQMTEDEVESPMPVGDELLIPDGGFPMPTVVL